VRSLDQREFWDGVVVDLLPGGFEPVIEEQPAAGRGGGAWIPDYVDLREDRVVAFGPIGATAREFTYRVRATTAGRFVVPPAYAESMYDPAVQARAAAAQVVVEAR